MIGLNDVRREIANRPTAVRAIMLTAQQSTVFDFIRKEQLRQQRPIRSSEVAENFDLSAQAACMVLLALHTKGYVDRQSKPQESGGYEYEYFSQID